MLLGKKSNCLLVKDDVGRAKPSTRRLPQNDHVYGKADLLRDRETATDVCSNWQVYASASHVRNDPRDFKKLNKMSLRSGSVNARDQYRFRASHDARIPFGLVEEKMMMLPSGDFSYGKPNRVQTPVGRIIQNTYGEASAAEKQAAYRAEKEAKASFTANNSIRMTHAQLGMHEAISQKYLVQLPQSKLDQFKLARFDKNAKAKVNTNRQ